MRFVVYEDNGCTYHWKIVADEDQILVRSASFASYEEAKQAAIIVHRGASQASVDDLAKHSPPVDLRARRDALTTRDRLEAEGWLDEGGTPTGRTVT